MWSQPGIDLLWPLCSDKYVGSQWTSDDDHSEQAEGIENPVNVSESAEDEDENYDDLPIGMDIEDFLDADASGKHENA